MYNDKNSVWEPINPIKKTAQRNDYMLLDVGILTGIYIGMRLFENYKEKKQQKNKNRVAHSVGKPQSSS